MPLTPVLQVELQLMDWLAALAGSILVMFGGFGWTSDCERSEDGGNVADGVHGCGGMDVAYAP